MPDPSFLKHSSGTIKPITGKDMGFHTFPNDICSKGNVIAKLPFEIAIYDSAVQRLQRGQRPILFDGNSINEPNSSLPEYQQSAKSSYIYIFRNLFFMYCGQVDVYEHYIHIICAKMRGAPKGKIQSQGHSYASICAWSPSLKQPSVKYNQQKGRINPILCPEY